MASALHFLAGEHGSHRRGGQEETFWALRDVSFEVKQGEVLGVVGRNGAGKSTLLKILSRITKPTVGRAVIAGRVGSLLEVGTGFHPELTGRENIALNAAIIGMRREEVRRRFDEMVAFAGVERFIDTPVKHYSNGMYLRLAFAVAAHLDPEILLVDEVLAVGDAAFQRKCLAKMGDVTKEGRTVLFVSHNLGAVRSLCAEGLWLDAGQVTATGPVMSVVDRYMESIFDRAASAVDLSSTPRRYGLGDRLRLLQLELNDGRPMHHGEPLTVRFKYESFGPMQEVAVGMGFNSPEGVRILTLDSDVRDVRCDLPVAQRGTVVMRLDTLFLQPGHYLLDIGARSGQNAVLDYIPPSLQVEVLPGPSTPGQMLHVNHGVHVPAQWDWRTA